MTNVPKLYTPQDSAVVFIDHQPQMTSVWRISIALC